MAGWWVSEFKDYERCYACHNRNRVINVGYLGLLWVIASYFGTLQVISVFSTAMRGIASLH